MYILALTLGNNINSLRAQRNLSLATDANAKTEERLSSGLRINRASDDAAGLAISSSLKTDSRIFSQAVRNVNDGISALNVASGAIDALSSIVSRQLELSEQAANGTLSRSQRTAIDTEADSLNDEFTRIAATTSFNGQKLLDGSIKNGIQIQLGYGNVNTLSFDTSQGVARSVGDGTFGALVTGADVDRSSISSAIDINKDGKSDIIFVKSGSINVTLGNGDGTFQAVISNSGVVAGVSSDSLNLFDLNGDGNLDAVVSGSGGTITVSFGDGKGQFTLGGTYVGDTTGAGNVGTAVGDFDGDGILDIAGFGSASNEVRIYKGNNSGTFALQNLFTTSQIAAGSGAQIKAADLNGDGKSDLVFGAGNSLSLISLLSKGSGSFQEITKINIGIQSTIHSVADYNNDGYDDVLVGSNGLGGLKVFLGTGNANAPLDAGTFYNSFSSGTNTIAVSADADGDGITDIIASSNSLSQIAFLKGKGDGTFSQSGPLLSTGPSLRRTVVGDFNGDGAPDIFALNNSAGQELGKFYGTPTKTVAQAPVNLLTRAKALETLDRFTTLQSTLSAAKSNLGSFYSRLQTSSNVLAVSKENYESANSRIVDADVAEESSQLIRTQTIQQAAAAILAQANQQPQLVLQLLR